MKRAQDVILRKAFPNKRKLPSSNWYTGVSSKLLISNHMLHSARSNPSRPKIIFPKSGFDRWQLLYANRSLCTRMNIRKKIYANVYAHTQTHTHTYIYIHIRVCSCIFICIFVCESVRMHLYTYACVCVRVSIYMYHVTIICIHVWVYLLYSFGMLQLFTHFCMLTSSMHDTILCMIPNLSQDSW